jgi:uracil-DNA glycosylase family 4
MKVNTPKCRNVTCTHGPVEMTSGGRVKRTPAVEGLHPSSGLCPPCQHALIIEPKPSMCLGCPLYEIGEGFAPGEGNKKAKIMLLGEALGEEEARQGRPFVGGSGRLLNAMLAQSGIYRNEIYVTNVVKCRPPMNREPDDEEIRHCARYLVEEIREVDPNLILAAGKTALYASTGETRIGIYRGVPTEGPGGRKVLATFHPAFIMRQQSYWPVAIWDMHKAKVEAEFREVRRVPVEYHNLRDARIDAQPVREAIARAGFATADLETTNLDPRTSTVRLYGLGWEIGKSRTYRWTLPAQHLLYTILGDPGVEKVGQNSEGFDWPFLEWKAQEFFKRPIDLARLRHGYVDHWEVQGPSFDTMVAFHMTNSDLPKNLATIATFYTDMPYWKDDTMYKSGEEGLSNGCNKDIDGTTRSYVGLKHELHTMGMDKLFYENVAPLQKILRRMAHRGIKKDVGKAGIWAAAMLKKAAEREVLLSESVGRHVNVQSPRDMMRLLYDELGLPVQYVKDRQRGKRPTANAEAIRKLAEDFPENKFLMLVNDIRSAYHTVSTNLEVDCDDEDFVHPRFGTSTAATGRLNSWDPNGQNIPIQLREIYIPDDKDHVFISIDWSQVEWRIAMVLSADPVGLDLLIRGVDNHKAIAAEGFGVRYEDVTKELRHAAKFIVYGLGYGRGAESIAKQLKRPKSWVEDFIRRFFNRFNRYEKWRHGLDDQVKRNAFLANAFGRRRWWYTRVITEMYNFPPQSTAADMMYVAIREAEEQLPKGASVRLTVHDELVVMCHRDVVREAAACLTAVMERKWPEIVDASVDPKLVKKFYPDGWFCPAEPTYGPNNWRETKLEDNPEKGLFPQTQFKKELGLL